MGSKSPIDLRNPGRTIHAGVILLNSETEFLDVGPIDMLNGLSNKFIKSVDPILPPGLSAQALDLEIHWVNESGKLAKLTAGLPGFQPSDTFATCPDLDIVLMGAAEFTYTPTEAELDFIRKSYETCAAFITVCAGVTAPLAAGILKDKTASAPRFMIDMLKQQAPNVNWVEKRWQRDGKLWTSGALLNGQDLMRAFAGEVWGGEGTLVEWWLSIGSWPNRDVDYKDEPLSKTEAAGRTPAVSA